MKGLSPRHWMAIGLLLLSIGLALRAIGPASLHSNGGDLATGLLMGLGLGIELMALMKMRRPVR
jgi:hypothetical protein